MKYHNEVRRSSLEKDARFRATVERLDKISFAAQFSAGLHHQYVRI